MPLSVGTRLGPYEIAAPLGAGILGIGGVGREPDSVAQAKTEGMSTGVRLWTAVE